MGPSGFGFETILHVVALVTDAKRVATHAKGNRRATHPETATSK
jgi:hypothetical protein